MSETLKEVLREAIEREHKKLAELEAELQRIEAEEAGPSRRYRRRRKATGLKPGGVPALVEKCLKEAGRPLTSAEISERLTKMGKHVNTRFIASSLHRYIGAGRIFDRTEDGLYKLKE